MPLVIAAQVPKDAIALFTNERDEFEAMLTKAPSFVTIDGTPDEWKSVSDMYERNRALAVA